MASNALPNIDVTADDWQRIDIKLDPSGLYIDQDLACFNCDYNVRGVSRERACPECGTAVDLAIANRKLFLLKPAWIRRITLGAWLLSYLFLAMAACCVLFSFAADGLRNNYPLHFVFGSFTILTLVALAGVWLFTSRPNSELESSRLYRMGIVSRGAAIILAVGIIAIPIASRMIGTKGTNAILLTILITFSLGGVFFSGYCQEVSSLLGKHHLRRRSLLYAWILVLGWLPLSYAILASNGVIGGRHVFTIWMIGSLSVILSGFLILVFPNHLLKELQSIRAEAEALIAESGLQTGTFNKTPIEKSDTAVTF